jgi:protein gp37
MNRQGKNGIEWTDWSWNPVVGCLHGCWYCYARKMAQRFKKIFPNGFKPTFHQERLLEPWRYKKPSKIFVCSIADLFAPWTPEKWRAEVLMSMLLCPVKHTFQLLTKNPERIPLDKTFPENFWLGTTVTCENEDWRNIESIKKVHCGVRFVSFEPLLGEMPKSVSLNGIDWIIIGKLTGSRKVKLDPAWVLHTLKKAFELKIPVFMKNNLKPEIPLKLIQEWPR